MIINPFEFVSDEQLHAALREACEPWRQERVRPLMEELERRCELKVRAMSVAELRRLRPHEDEMGDAAFMELMRRGKLEPMTEEEKEENEAWWAERE